jgi:hypothetical protein
MTALTRAKPGSIRRIHRDGRPLAANVKAWQGAVAMVILSGTGKGYYCPADDAKIGVAVGRFYETKDNTGGAAGAVSVQIEFFRERVVMLVANDTDTPVVVADREGPCYVLDDQTVTGTVGTAHGGPVYDVTTEGVWVEIGHKPPVAAELGLSDVAPADPSSTAASAGSEDAAARRDHKHHIALATPAAEGLMSAAKAGALHAPVADRTALKAIAAADRASGMLCLVLSDMSLWRFHSSSTAADTTENLVATPAAGSGRWLRVPGAIDLSLAFAFGTADAAALFTVPTGARLLVRRGYWEVAVSMTGGTDSAIGASSNATGHTTKGDLHGGAAGDVAASLTAGVRLGTIGADVAAGILLVATNTIRFDRIVDAFTAGSGNLHFDCEILANPGA